MASPVAQKLGNVVNTAADKLQFGPNEWEIHDTETNAAVSATLAAVAGVQHFIRQIIVSFSAVPAAACTLTVSSASTQIYPTVQIGVAVAGPVIIDLPAPGLQCAVGEALTLALTSPGNITATVGAIGYSSPGPQATVAAS